MTDKEIEKAVNRCRKDNCTKCPFYNISGCLQLVDYINRLKAEKEQADKEQAERIVARRAQRSERK